MRFPASIIREKHFFERNTFALARLWDVTMSVRENNRQSYEGEIIGYLYHGGDIDDLIIKHFGMPCQSLMTPTAIPMYISDVEFMIIKKHFDDKSLNENQDS